MQLQQNTVCTKKQTKKNKENPSHKKQRFRCTTFVFASAMSLKDWWKNWSDKKNLEQERVDQSAFKNNDLNLLKISNGCTKCIGKQLRGSNTWLWRGVRCNTQHDLQPITILLFAEWRHWESNGFEREMLILATKCFEQFPHRWAK